MALTDLPKLLRDEPALLQVLGRSAAVLAVPEAGAAHHHRRAGHVGSRRPILVAVPTTAEAERLVHDLATFLGPDAVELFPAWETLPFERVSPGVETMGRRLRTIWRLRAGGDRLPGGRGGPGPGPGPAARPPRRGHRAARRPARRAARPGRARRLARPARLPARGPGRAPRRVRRARLDRRRVPLHRRRPGPHRPVGRRGRPPHRVLGQRPALHRRPRPRSRCSRAGSCCPPTTCGRGPSGWSPPSRGAASSGSAWPRGSSSTAWRAGCRGWSTTTGPRRPAARRRPGAAASSPAACATGPPTCWPRRPTWPRRWPAPGRSATTATFPPLHAEFAELLAHTTLPGVDRDRHARRARRRHRRRHGWNPVVGDGEGLTGQLRKLLDEGYRIVVAADGEGSAARLGDLLREQGLDARRRGRRRSSGAASSPASSWRSWPRPTSPAGAGPTGRRGPASATPPASSTTSSPATTSSTTSTASAATAAWSSGPSAASSATTCCSSTGATTSSTSRSDQIDAVRHYTGGDSPALSKLGGGDWTKTKARVKSEVAGRRPGAGGALPEAPPRAGPRLPRGHAVAARAGGRLPVPGDARPAEGHRRGQGRHGGRPSRWTAWSAATSASARPRWRSGPRSRRSRTASRWRSSCPPRCSPRSTSRPSATASPRFPVRVEVLSPVPHRRPGQGRWPRACAPARSTA